MLNYPWPGNVRELQNAIYFTLFKAKGDVIRWRHLPMELKDQRPRRGPDRKLNADVVRAALERTGGNKAKATRILGVGQATLYRFLGETGDVL